MKRSAGLLLYKATPQGIQVLLGHPGGPFWAKKDKAAWSIPKGECAEDEDPLVAAKREFAEEMGHDVPTGTMMELGSFKVSSSKTVAAWAVEADLDASTVRSNLFEMEWPPKSGQKQQFLEIDKAGWFTLEKAKVKLVKGQVQIIDRLAELIGATSLPAAKQSASPGKTTPTGAQEQTSLF